MNNPINKFDQISIKLLSFIREEIGDSKIDFVILPAKIEGGNETAIFHYLIQISKPGSILARIRAKEIWMSNI